MASSHPQALAPGTRLDAFRIDSVLGVGGFGITYAAFDQTLQCPVAIKEYFPSDLASRTESSTAVAPTSGDGQEFYEYGLTRFLQEARTLAQFHEPNIVRVRSFIEANGTAYLIMDYEAGSSLGSVLSHRERLSEEETKDIALDCLRGLRAMHAQSYLHRDIKPENIFLRKSGSAVLLDFGAARLALKNQKNPMTIILTPGYAPVEQYGHEEQQGPWTDLYAMGATLYHCVTGQTPPPSTERLSTIARGKSDAAVEWLDSLEGRFDSSLLAAVRWMIHPLADGRPKDAGEVFSFILESAGKPRITGPDPWAKTEIAPAAQTPKAPKDQQPTVFDPAGSADGYSGFHGSKIAGRPGRPVDAECLASAKSSLAAILGPIADVIVQRAAEKAGSVEELHQLLADELDDEAERNQFFKSLRY